MAKKASLLRWLGRPRDVVARDVSLVDRWKAGEGPAWLFAGCEILFNVKAAVFRRLQIDVEAIHGGNAVLANQTHILRKRLLING
jgi:hypothetical protein